MLYEVRACSNTIVNHDFILQFLLFCREDSPHYKDKLNKKPHREELDNEIISIDGIIVGPKNTITTTKYPEDLQYEESRVRDVRPPPPAPTKANAVVYSFKNNYGLKEQVGVIFDENPKTEQVTKIFNKQHMAQDRHDSSRGSSEVSPGQSSNFIPLEKKPAEIKSQPQSFPLGNPFGGPVLKARPEFFPALHYPPLYKTKPTKLEGSFGPALPPKPEPDVIHFPDEELPGVVREAPKAPVRPKLPRKDDFVPTSDNSYIYKTVRDMDYSRPKDILSVRPSGELYVPDPREAHAPLGDVEPRIPILPGVGSFEDLEQVEHQHHHQQQQQHHHHEDQHQGEPQLLDPADDRIWKADFSDVLDGDQELGQDAEEHQTNKFSGGGVPTLSDIFTLKPAPPLDLDLSGSIRDPVVFKEDNYKRPGSSFKFPGKSTSDSIRPIGGSNRKPPPNMINKLIDIAKGPTSENIEHQYSVVIGLNYDDENPDVIVKDYDDDVITDDQPYSQDELYQLCIKEVPSHLHRELCGYIRDGKPASGIPSTKQLPPKQSRLIQDHPHQAPIQQNSFQVVKQDHSHNPFAGIPTELPVQISKSPLVITSNSKVKIYKPFEEAPRLATTTATTTATTYRTTTTTPTTLPSRSVAPPALPVSNTNAPHSRNRRPLIFSKRDPNTGETKLSQPFEYFNRLTQFFNNRVNHHSQQNSQQQQRRRPPPPPRLQRQRIRLPPQT